MDTLPNEMLMAILDFLADRYVPLAALVCWRWRELLSLRDVRPLVGLAHESVSLAAWCIEGGCPSSGRVCDAAASGGRLDVLKVLRAGGHSWGVRTIALAARWGHMETVRWMHESGCPWDELTAAAAALGGHSDLLEWLHGAGCPWDESTCTMAAQYGRVELIRWARARGCPWNSSDVAEHIARLGDMESTRWVCEGLRTSDKPWGRGTGARGAVAGAARGGHLRILIWLDENRLIDDRQSICTHATRGMHLGVLRWARERFGCLPRAKAIYRKAAKYGRFDLLDWARSEGIPWSSDAWECAGQGGVDVLRWVMGCGHALSPLACHGAALEGNLETLRWLRANGCEWGSETCRYAISGGVGMTALRWLTENGCRTCDYIWWTAASDGTPEILRWLYDAGTPGSDWAYRGAVDSRRVGTLQWLKARGLRPDRYLALLYATGGHVQTVSLIGANGPPWNEPEARPQYHSGCEDTLRWMMANGWSGETEPHIRAWMAKRIA